MTERVTQNDAFWAGHDPDLALVAGLEEYMAFTAQQQLEEPPEQVDAGPNAKAKVHESDVSWFFDDYACGLDDETEV